MSATRVAVLSPHLDDAVLSTWGVLCGSSRVRVVNVCTGIPADDVLSPWDRLTGATSSRARMLERLREDRVALSQADCEATALDLPEAQYRDGPLDPEVLRNALLPAVDGATELWAPAGIGGHDDHLQVRDAALELSRAGGPKLRLYADLPYAVRYGWPGWVCGRDEDPHLVVNEWWGRFLPAGQGLTAHKRTLSASQAEAKLSALAAYRTQLPGLNGGPLELLHRPDVIPYEVHWELEQ